VGALGASILTLTGFLKRELPRKYSGGSHDPAAPGNPRGAPPYRPDIVPLGANWAMLKSSGILVSAFDSEATGEFA
jgi:transposase